MFAGMGPDSHCKHVQAVLWGLVCWGRFGTVITEETCTQRLQTFHKAKKMKGSPSKAATLAIGSDDCDYDPRPLYFRNNPSYPTFVRNMIINRSKDKMPIEQTIEPANSYEILHDHGHYTASKLQDVFLAQQHLTEITEEEIRQVEEKTRGQATNKAWAQERCKRVQSSQFGRICKATAATDMAKLSYSMTRHTPITSDALKHGRKYESVAIKKFEVENSVKVEECGIVVSHSHPYLACSPDGKMPLYCKRATDQQCNCPLSCQQ